MTRLINKISGAPMWVADNRVEEYLAAGHKPAAAGTPEEPKEKPEKKTTKKK